VAYHRPPNLVTALEALRADGAVPLAGGTDLVMMRTAGMVELRQLVDIKRIAVLRSIEASGEGVTVGAAVTMREIACLDANRLGALVDGARVVGGLQTRSRATIGGNVCRASPAGDTIAGLLVLGGHLELVSSTGARIVALASFFTGPGLTIRGPEELAVRLHIPALAGGSAYERHTYRKWLDLAVVGVGARVAFGPDGACVDAEVAVSAAAPTPLLVPDAGRALVGSRCGPEAVANAAEALAAAVDPIDDVRGTRAYRLRVLPELLRRAVARAVVRANPPQHNGFKG
jgi:carbon-monoxide dehydrogenase medium subunit